MVNQYSFIVTNMTLTPEEILKFYCDRGKNESALFLGITFCNNDFET